MVAIQQAIKNQQESDNKLDLKLLGLELSEDMLRKKGEEQQRFLY